MERRTLAFERWEWRWREKESEEEKKRKREVDEDATNAVEKYLSGRFLVEIFKDVFHWTFSAKISYVIICKVLNTIFFSLIYRKL